MKKVILDNSDNICINNISENTPIFAKENNKLIGMLVLESDGWILKIGGKCGSHGHSKSRSKCLQIGVDRYNYEYFIEDDDE